MSLNLNEYEEGSSLLHKLDARIKIVCSFAAIFGVVFLSHWQMPLLVLFTCFALAVFSHSPIKTYLARLLYPTYIIVFVTIIQPFAYGSTVIAKVPWLSLPIYQEGVVFGILVFTRALSAVAILNLLILVTPMEKVLDSLRWFKIPASITDTMMLMFRYISLLSEESARIRKAQESRLGYSKRVSVIKQLGNFGTLAGMLLLRSFDRALKVGDAMISRGYTGTSNLFSYSTVKVPKKDSLIGALSVIAVIGLLLIDLLII
jgi:cobalt/nickel transport system permease protein